MKVLINRKPIYDQPWGGGNNFVKAFVKFGKERGHEIIHTLEDEIDCIFMQDPRPSELFDISANEIVKYKLENPKTLLVHRVNECDARKGTKDMDNLLQSCSIYSDITFFVSKWIKLYFENKGWTCDNKKVVYNGVDKDIFCPNKKLNNRKVDIVTHHWSNNEMKGFDIYRKLDEFVGRTNGFSFTYIGRENGKFKNTNVIPPLFGKELGKELGKYDVYVSGSRFDPGPNHILEALSCEIPTYAFIDGGGCLEMVGNDHVYSTFQELLDVILGGGMLKNSQFTLNSWKECIDIYFDTIEKEIKLC